MDSSSFVSSDLGWAYVSNNQREITLVRTIQRKRLGHPSSGRRAVRVPGDAAGNAAPFFSSSGSARKEKGNP